MSGHQEKVLLNVGEGRRIYECERIFARVAMHCAQLFLLQQ